MNDKTIRDDVLEALAFDPSVTVTDIGVAVRSGVVILSGQVASFAEKTAAEHCVLRVRGVKAIAGELTVRYPFYKRTADDQIAQRAQSILDWHCEVPKDCIGVTVDHGVVTLTGRVPWHYQKEAADAAIRKLTGVVALHNAIRIAPHPSTADLKDKIVSAFKRDAELDGSAIEVYIEHDKVRLEGSVKAWPERSIAESAAWSAPGVCGVEDNLKVA